MEILASYQKRIILLLLLIIFSGLLLKLIDRQHKAMGFNIAGFLDGYRYSVTLNNDYRAANLSTQTAELPTTKKESKNVSVDAEFTIDINSADVVSLQRLPGIGPVLAQRIIAYRDSIGEYVDAEELLDVKGIGEKKLAGIREYLEF
jgi:competence ComEA-like helix-hairpin-helix protein